MRGKRKRRPEIRALRTMQLRTVLEEGQVFYETEKAYEIWKEEPLKRIIRIPKSRVYWVFTDDPARDEQQLVELSEVAPLATWNFEKEE